MGAFPDLDLSFLLCPFLSVLFSPFFPDFRGFSRSVHFLFLGLLQEPPTRNIPESVRDTKRTFPEKSLHTPGYLLSK